MAPNAWLYWAAILLLSITCQPTHGIEEEEEMIRPHQIYMQELHGKYDGRSGPPYPESSEKSEGGVLLATSIAADKASVIPDGGFPVKNGSSLRLFFTVPKHKDANNIQSAELWLFPDAKSVRAGHAVDVILSVTAFSLPDIRTPRRDALELAWRPEQGCMVLDLTSLTKKISKKLKDPSKSNVTVSVDILSVIEYRVDADLPDSPTSRERVNTCRSLHASTSDSPFLVVKFFTRSLESEIDGIQSEVSLGQTEPTTPPEKRQTASGDSDNRSTGTSDWDNANDTNDKLLRNDDCRLVDYSVNFTEIGMNTILSPRVYNIKGCAGRCSPRYAEDITNHAVIKQLANYNGVQETRVTCVPVAYRPAYLLVHDHRSIYFVLMTDFVATACGCR